MYCHTPQQQYQSGFVPCPPFVRNGGQSLMVGRAATGHLPSTRSAPSSSYSATRGMPLIGDAEANHHSSETVIWLKGETQERVQRLIGDKPSGGFSITAPHPSAGGSVKVSRRGSVALGELQHELGIMSVIECDPNGIALPRSMVMASPAQVLHKGRCYVAQSCKTSSVANTRVEDFMLSAAGNKRCRSPDGRVHAHVRAEGTVVAPPPRRRGVTFNSKVFVKEYNIGHTVDGYSQSFSLSLSSSSLESAHRRQALANPYGPIASTANSASTVQVAYAANSHRDLKPPAAGRVCPTITDPVVRAHLDTHNSCSSSFVAEASSSGAEWRWKDLSELIGQHYNEVCRIHHLVESKRSAAVAGLRSEIDSFLGPYMDEILLNPKSREENSKKHSTCTAIAAAEASARPAIQLDNVGEQ